jgi:hypothetical protein
MAFWDALHGVLTTDYSAGLEVVDALRLVDAPQRMDAQQCVDAQQCLDALQCVLTTESQ